MIARSTPLLWLIWHEGKPPAFFGPTLFGRGTFARRSRRTFTWGAQELQSAIGTTKILRILRGMTVLQGDQKTSAIYASIRCDLERRGPLIPHNDIWIAASSIQADVPLITRDKHFRHVSGLKLEEY